MIDLQGIHVELQIVGSVVHELERALRVARPISRVFLRERMKELREHLEIAQAEVLSAAEQDVPCPSQDDIPY